MTLLTALTLLVAVVAGARGTWSPCGLSMISAINPVAERGRGNRYWVTVLWFGAGAVFGGALLGGGIGLLSWAVNWAMAAHSLVPVAGRTVLVGVLGSLGALVAVASDRQIGGWRLPLHPRQVNERWLGAYRRWIYAAGFGAQIGVAFATYIMTAATYLLVLLGALGGSPGTAFLAGVTFGLVRGGAVLISARARSPQQLLAVHRRLARLEPTSLALAVVVEAICAVGLAARVAPAAGPITAAAVALALILAGPLGARERRRPVTSVAVEP